MKQECSGNEASPSGDSSPVTSRRRVEIALQGGRSDRAPVVPIYDYGYVMRSTGRDMREWVTATAAERIQAIEESFLRHPHVDGLFVHFGCNDDWAEQHRVERLPEIWRVTHRQTGEQFGLLPDGSRCGADGSAQGKDGQGIDLETKIQAPEDIERVVGPAPTEADLRASGQFLPLAHLARTYPDRHFSFQSGSPMVFALNACGGYVPGLTTMASDVKLYRKILERHAEHQCSLMATARQAGACSTWFTSYYTGADTISPRDYAEVVFPFDRMVCQEARRQGFFVLNWYLGDLMPNLDKVMELPLDALVLEQGRKGYEIDPVKIRSRVGSDFCLFGFGLEQDYCTFNREGLAAEIRRQFQGAGKEGGFVVGTPIIPPNAIPEAVDYYFSEARQACRYPNPAASHITGAPHENH